MRRLRSSTRVLGVLLMTMLVASPVLAQGTPSGRSGSRDRTPPPVVDENPYAIAEEENPYGHEGSAEEASPPPVGTSTVQVPDAPVAEAQPVVEASPYGDVASENARADGDERVKFHALGLGWHATMFSTDVRNGYTLQGPEVAYTYFVGRRWGFSMRGAIYFPTSGFMSGPDQTLRIKLRESYDQSRIGLDTVIGVGRRFELTEDLAFLVGMGVHVQSFRLNGTNYYPVEGITAGLGGYARIDWHISELFSLGVDLESAIDLVDFIGHENRIFFLSPLAGALTFGVTY